MSSIDLIVLASFVLIAGFIAYLIVKFVFMAVKIFREWDDDS
jgi:hypothetical protein